MSFRIQWAQTALVRVEQLAGYIALDGPAAAVRMVEHLFERV
jgi:plasmid stabilization system protein ParE